MPAEASSEEELVRRRKEVRSSLEEAQAASLGLLMSLNEADLDRRASGSGWTVREVATHLVTSVERVPALIGALRIGQDYMSYPPSIFQWIRRVYTWWTARGVTQEALVRRLDAAYAVILAMVDTIHGDEWGRAGHAYDEGSWTVERALLHQREHGEEHIGQIREILGRA